jgi:hypothetical protein
MFSSGRRSSKVVRIIIDVLNIILGVAAIVMAVITFINTTANAWMFPLIFLVGALMNLLTGIKHMMCERKAQGVVLLVVSVVLLILTYASYVAVGGL